MSTVSTPGEPQARSKPPIEAVPVRHPAVGSGWASAIFAAMLVHSLLTNPTGAGH